MVFKESVLNLFLAPMVKLGGASRDIVLALSAKCLHKFEPAFECDLDDEYISVLQEISDVLRGLIGLLDPFELDYISEASMLCAAGIAGQDAGRHGQTSAAMMRAMLARDASWIAEIHNFVETDAGTRIHAAAFTNKSWRSSSATRFPSMSCAA